MARRKKHTPEQVVNLLRGLDRGEVQRHEAVGRCSPRQVEDAAFRVRPTTAEGNRAGSAAPDSWFPHAIVPPQKCRR
jgi:hypothetical protein